MTGSARERNVRGYWDEVWSKGNVEAARAFYAPVFALNGEEISVADFTRNAASWLTHFTDFSAEVLQVIACGDVVVSRVVYRARHTGDFKTVPARGTTLELSGIDIFEFQDERVTRHWHEADHWSMFQQLGAEPRLVGS